MARYRPPKPHHPDEPFCLEAQPLNDICVGGFWQWAFSNFADNTIRGILAEYLIGSALKCDMSIPRDPWGNFDLLTPEDIRVEVKASGRVQSWDSRGSKPVFSGLKGQLATADGASYEGPQEFRADVYVFALQTAEAPEEFRPLDLDQWRFWIISQQRLEALNQKSIGLSRVEKLGKESSHQTLRQNVSSIFCEAKSQKAPKL